MAKKGQAQTGEKAPTELTITKTEFNSGLDKRIAIGEEAVNRKINSREEFDVWQDDFAAWNDYNSEYLKQSFNYEYSEYRTSYDNAGSGIDIFGTSISSGSELQDFRDKINYKLNNLKKLRAKTELLKTSINYATEVLVSDSQIDTSQIFIVHGHDDEAKIKAARFVEKIGFKPIILHEQASSGKTIIEKIEEYSNVGFGIVLYTPCDLGGKKTETPTYNNRARQNVVFEHGYLMGKIGRDKVCALVKGDVETPNDISGVVYINMDTEDAWHLKLAKELRNSGYPIDMNKII